jgi:hypothetical protein
VTITVEVAHTPPSADPDTVNTEPGVPVDIYVLDNDTGETALYIQSFDDTSVHGGSVMQGENNYLVYTPDQVFTGTDTFTYTVADENELTDTAIVTVNVMDLP